MKREKEFPHVETFLALVCRILTVAGTALVAKGYIDASQVEPAIGAILTTGSTVWSGPTSGCDDCPQKAATQMGSKGDPFCPGFSARQRSGFVSQQRAAGKDTRP